MEILLYIIELIGIATFAAAGAMVAIDKETDLFGVVFLAIITCFGGGIIRDIIRNDGLPLFFTDMTAQIIVCVVTALIVFMLAAILKEKYVKEKDAVMKIINYLDAAGLGIFAAAGTQLCMESGPFVAITLGMITSVGGSLTRDIILNDIPFILRKRIYALATIIGSLTYYLIASIATENAAVHVIATVACSAVVFSIRICATVFKWKLPKAILFDKISEKEKDGRGDR